MVPALIYCVIKNKRKHINNLLNMELVENYSNLNALRKLYYMCQIIIVTNFRNLGVTSTSYGHLSHSILLKLLPDKLLIKAHGKSNRNNEWYIINISSSAFS